MISSYQTVYNEDTEFETIYNSKIYSITKTPHHNEIKCSSIEPTITIKTPLSTYTPYIYKNSTIKYFMYRHNGLESNTIPFEIPSDVIEYAVKENLQKFNSNNELYFPREDSFCESQNYCFKFYKAMVIIYVTPLVGDYYPIEFDIYTHRGDEPTPTESVEFKSYCKPTYSLIPTPNTHTYDYYGTTQTHGNLVTEEINKVITRYTSFKTSVYCKTSSVSTAIPTTNNSSNTKKAIIIKKRAVPSIFSNVSNNGSESITDDSKCVNKWAQCGGIGYTGPTCCQDGLTCHKINKYFSQCI